MSHQETMDGNEAAAHIAYGFSELAVVYPITPSSPMADDIDKWSIAGRKNLWGQTVEISEMQSESGVAGALHGMLKTGALATTCTSSQGLLLMIPNMYKIAGELLPTVIHVAARALATSALSIFGDHSDVMSTRTTGFAMLAESSVQEVMDLSAVAHLATLESSVPFLSFFDGLRTSHEIQKIQVLDYEELKPLFNGQKLTEFRDRAMSSEHPKVSGTNQNPDIHFQQRELVNSYYENLSKIVQNYMYRINAIRGTAYDLVDYYGAEDAEEVIISMGSVAGTIRQTVDYLNAQGRKTGFLNLHLYRPFPKECLLGKLPKTVKSIAVLDRTKESGANGEPLFLDVRNALFERNLKIIGGRYGIGGKDTRPEHILSVFDELRKSDSKKQFTVGIHDDVSKLSLKVAEPLDLTASDTYQIKVWGYASDGEVGANRAITKIIGRNTEQFVQGFFQYDSKKSGGLTVSHLRFSPKPILSEYAIIESDLVECANPSYLYRYDLLKGLKKGGIFLLNCSQEKLEKGLPNHLKKYIADNDIQFYIVEASKISHEAGLGVHINIVMKVCLFKLTQFMSYDIAYDLLKKDLQKYGKYSEKMIHKNLTAMESAENALHKVKIPESWKKLSPEKEIYKKKISLKDSLHKKYVFNLLDKIDRCEGDELSVQDLLDSNMTRGDTELGTAAYEKRGISNFVPEWNPEFCVKCHRCSFVCPHAAIRPFLLDEDEWNRAPEGFKVLDYKGKDGLKYRIQVSVQDCTGCGLCVEACPQKGKALKRVSAQTQADQITNWAFAMTLKQKENPAHAGTVVSTQFNQPLFEFSSACAGCGETPYIKLLTQMFGERMMIANATGCSSIYGGAQATPYTTNAKGQGPAWSNSLFEDNAEFGYGMWKANKKKRNKLAQDLTETLDEMSEKLCEATKDWLNHFEDSEDTVKRSEALKNLLASEHYNSEKLASIWERRDLLVKSSQWIIGGDGWAYDIGFGGLDHIIATGSDVNILVMDNEIYANTDGQLSKATPVGAVTQFAHDGKIFAKKDLGFMEMTYGNVYVAQIASGANMMQTIRAFDEAEKHHGPSLIIAYTPCISHGLRGGLSQSLNEAKEAVESGYWQLYRYNPELENLGANPLQLDFKKPDFTKMYDFMMKQARFANLKKVNPDQANSLHEKAVKDARTKFLRYARLSGDAEKFLAWEENLGK